MKRARIAIAFLILIWPIFPPILHMCKMHALAALLEWPWAQTCHRLPSRTMSLFGFLMPMCSRCTGLDVGFGLGLLIVAPYRGPKLMWIWIAIASALMAIEIFTQENGMHPIWHVTRFATGALLAYPIGVAFGAVVLRSKRDA